MPSDDPPPVSSRWLPRARAPCELAAHRRLTAVDETGQILIVCTGNICRSPFIERLLTAELRARCGDRAPSVRSAGTGALAGQAMDERAADQLIRAGGSPDGFLARQLTPELIAAADLVLTATRTHRGEVAIMHPKALRYVFTFRDFADLLAQLDPSSLPDAGPGSTEHLQSVVAAAAARRGAQPPLSSADADIVDPFRREDEVFVQMSQQVLASMPAVVDALTSQSR